MKEKITLTFLAQQYGMTVEILQARYPGVEIIIEKNAEQSVLNPKKKEKRG